VVLSRNSTNGNTEEKHVPIITAIYGHTVSIKFAVTK
jgi:desulfoferrodoxin (superoxide reductase-like protein)